MLRAILTPIHLSDGPDHPIASGTVAELTAIVAERFPGTLMVFTAYRGDEEVSGVQCRGDVPGGTRQILFVNDTFKD